MNTETEIEIETEEEYAEMVAEFEAQQSAEYPLWMYGY